MPVRRYRSVAEMGDTSRVDPHRPDLGRIIQDVWTFSARVAPARPPRGVAKLESIEALNWHRQHWVRDPRH